MTEKRAINILKKLRATPFIGAKTCVALDMAISSLNKQIKKKPIKLKAEQDIKIGAGTWKAGTTVYKCPCCNSFISRSSVYCDQCAKALDWSDSE